MPSQSLPRLNSPAFCSGLLNSSKFPTGTKMASRQIVKCVPMHTGFPATVFVTIFSGKHAQSFSEQPNFTDFTPRNDQVNRLQRESSRQFQTLPTSKQ